MKYKHLISTLLLAVPALSVSPLALAQDIAEDKDDSGEELLLEEVVVTGSMRASLANSIAAKPTRALVIQRADVAKLQAVADDVTGAGIARSRAGTRQIRPADEIDSVYGATLREAAQAGVEIMAYGCELGESEIVLAEAVPVELDSPA